MGVQSRNQLAEALAGFNREQLLDLACRRLLLEQDKIIDQLSLARALLDPVSIYNVLPRLNVLELYAIEQGFSDDPAIVQKLVELGIAVPRHIADVHATKPYPATIPAQAHIVLSPVTKVLGQATKSAQITLQKIVTKAKRIGKPCTPVNDRDNTQENKNIAYTAAAQAVSDMTAVLMELRYRPCHLNDNGTIKRIHTPNLANAAGIELERVQLVLLAASIAGFASRDGETLIVNRRGLNWIDQPYTKKWVELGYNLWDGLPREFKICLVRCGCQTEKALKNLRVFYPLMTRRTTEAIQQYGLLLAWAGLEIAGRVLKWTDKTDFEKYAKKLPEILRGVYTQKKLAIVVPGPLKTEHELTLLRVSQSGRGKLAGTRWLSHAKLYASIRSVEDAQALRQELQSISRNRLPADFAHVFHEIGEQPPEAILTPLQRHSKVRGLNENSMLAGQAACPPETTENTAGGGATAGWSGTPAPATPGFTADANPGVTENFEQEEENDAPRAAVTVYVFTAEMRSRLLTAPEFARLEFREARAGELVTGAGRNCVEKILYENGVPYRYIGIKDWFHFESALAMKNLNLVPGRTHWSIPENKRVTPPVAPAPENTVEPRFVDLVLNTKYVLEKTEVKETLAKYIEAEKPLQLTISHRGAKRVLKVLPLRIIGDRLRVEEKVQGIKYELPLNAIEEFRDSKGNPLC